MLVTYHTHELLELVYLAFIIIVVNTIIIIKYYKEYEDGDGNAEFNYEGIDQRGDKCKVELKIFKKPLSPHIATMDIKYNDVYIILRLMKDE